MQILIINHYAGSPELGMEFRHYYLAKEWKKIGHEVLIIGASYSHLRKAQPNAGLEKIDGINYLWIKTNSYKGNGLGRILSMISFVFKLYLNARNLAKSFQPDVVISSSVYPLGIYPAHEIARNARAKHVFEVHDLWPLTAIELGGYSKYHPFILVMKQAEIYAYRHCDKVVSILPLAKDYMLKLGLKPNKFSHIPNGIAPEDWINPIELPKGHQMIINRLKNEGKFIVGFSGAHGIANSLDSIIDAASKLIENDVVLILVGTGQQKKKLITYVEKSRFKNIYFLDPISKYAIPTFLKQMDVLFIGLKKESLFRFGISPNKIFDYMMASKPIIQSIEAGNNLVKEANCGFSVEPENANAIAEAVLKLKSMSDDERNNIGKNGFTYVNKHNTYNVLANRFIEFIEKSHINCY